MYGNQWYKITVSIFEAGYKQISNVDCNQLQSETSRTAKLSAL